ncbi:MAG: lipoyl synthase [Planctomycetes bacterium GWF2_50_10]|nr:MAG: lipoyl synthase [Planctomycetes bacterium GWF2_50_10]
MVQNRLPEWLRRPMPAGGQFYDTSKTLSELKLETICTNACCPNRGECWKNGTATVLILGNICTRNCRFCSVAKGKPLPPDPTEPARVAQLAVKLNLKYLVITCVDRDDLPDGGAAHFRDVITETRKAVEGIRFEILTGDFRNTQEQALAILETALPFVFGHNIETVPSLYSKARPGGNYQLSLTLLKKAKDMLNCPTKSAMMLGLGEKDEEIEAVLSDLRAVNCDRVSIGQYLRPSKDSLEVVEYVHPDKFDFWAARAKQLGFTWVMSSPFTRSSYHAETETA